MSTDPRFLRRRSGLDRSVIKRKRRFRLIIATGMILAAAAVLLTLSAYHLLTDPDQFVLRRVLVDGAEFSDSDLISKEVISMTHGNMLMVDLKQVCFEVEKFTWVKVAQARKVLPDILHLTIVEHSPAIFVLIDGDVYLADESGLIIDSLKPEHPFFDLPMARGVEGLEPQEMAERIQLATTLLTAVKIKHPEWYDRISEVYVADPRRLTIVLSDRRAPIIVGDRDFVSRLKKYFGVEASLHHRYDTIDYIDVRFRKRLIVKSTGG